MELFTIENNGTITNLVYQVKPSDVLDTMSVGMMANNKIEGIVPFFFTQVDAQRFIKYNISSKVKLEQYFVGTVTKARLLGVFSSIAEAILTAEEYMIEYNSLLICKEYMYVDVSTSHTELICIPLLEQKNEVKLDIFFKEIMFSTQFDSSENCDYVARILSYLNSGQAFDLLEFKEVINELLYGKEKEVKPGQEKAKVTREVEAVTVVDASAFIEKNPHSVSKQEVLQPLNREKTEAKKERGEEKQSKIPKEKRGLFGGRKKRLSKQAGGIGNVAIPGGIPADKIPSEPKKSKPLESKPIPSVPSTGQVIPDAFHQTNRNFGETTVLGMSSGGVGETTVLGLENVHVEVRPYLIRKSNQEKRYIDKEIFRIGKENSYVDFFIGDNTAISRSHANIIMKDGKYYVVDMNSKNHTYIDGRMIQPNVEEEIQPGSMIRLADEEFEFGVS